MADLMEKIVSLAKRRGFVFPGSEIYGGLANSWDYGPLGVELKNNIKNLWWDRFVRSRGDVVGLDTAFIMNPKVWEASGHLKEFSDPLVECKTCNYRGKVDDLVFEIKDFQNKFKGITAEFSKIINEEFDAFNKIDEETKILLRAFETILKENDVQLLTEVEKKNISSILSGIINEVDKKIPKLKEKNEFISFVIAQIENSKKYLGLVAKVYLDRWVTCPKCYLHTWNVPKQFNLMLKTFLGPVDSNENIVYFRPETAQGMFVNFKNILDTTRKTLPFGIAQVGKAFRNEITPGNFIFRTREFEQMEIEYFIRESEWEKWFEYWRKEMWSWMTDDLGLHKKNIHELKVPDGDRAHYSKRTIDFEYDYPFGKKELYGLAYRTDFDLRNHFKEPPYKEEGSDAFYPHVIEPTWGVDRSVLAVLLDSYAEEEDRTVLKLPAKIAPYKAAVFPLLANKPQLVELARKIYDDLRQYFMVAWDDRGNIGKRYYSQDEIGTPYCITVDFESIEKGDVTVRERDTAKQGDRVPIGEIKELLRKKLS